MDNELLFFFSAIGVFNTVCIALYLLLKQKSLNFQFLFALALLLIGIRTGVACIYFFYHQLPPILIQLGLVANLLSGVCLYLFLKSDSNKVAYKDLVHLLAVTLILLLFGLFVPFSKYFIFWDNTLRYILHGILSIYVITSWVKILLLSRSHNDNRIKLKKLVLSGFSLVYLSFSISLYTNYIFGPILYSILFYAFYFIGYELLGINFKEKKRKYRNKKIDRETAQQLINKINKDVLGRKLFKKQNLNVRELATLIDIPPHQLSQLLNDNLGLSFSTYINKFRIEEAKKMLTTEKLLTIEAIGEEAGFSSKTTFFKVFKAETGQTPRTFVKS